MRLLLLLFGAPAGWGNITPGILKCLQLLSCKSYFSFTNYSMFCYQLTVNQSLIILYCTCFPVGSVDRADYSRIIVSVQYAILSGSKFLETCENYYRSRALKSRSKLRAALGIFLLHRNSSLFTVTFGEKVLTLAKSRGS